MNDETKINDDTMQQQQQQQMVQDEQKCEIQKILIDTEFAVFLTAKEVASLPKTKELEFTDLPPVCSSEQLQQMEQECAAKRIEKGPEGMSYLS